LTRFIRACTTEFELSRIAADPNSKGAPRTITII
jgi:hypothetical protein